VPVVVAIPGTDSDIAIFDAQLQFSDPRILMEPRDLTYRTGSQNLRIRTRIGGTVGNANVPIVSIPFSCTLIISQVIWAIGKLLLANLKIRGERALRTILYPTV
jgi:hypothetical protein